MTAAVRVDIAGGQVGGAALSALRCMLSAVFAKLMLQKLEILPTRVTSIDEGRP